MKWFTFLNFIKFMLYSCILITTVSLGIMTYCFINGEYAAGRALIFVNIMMILNCFTFNEQRKTEILSIETKQEMNNLVQDMRNEFKNLY